MTLSRKLKERVRMSAQRPAGSDDGAASMVTSLLSDEQQTRFGRKRKVHSDNRLQLEDAH